MAKDCRENGTSYKGVSSVNLDEYVGLTADHDQSYAYFMRTNLFDKIDIDLNNTNLPKGSAKDLQAECDRYNALLETKQQDVQVLGLGSNGHIGFNEPGTPLDSLTHLVDLTENTIKDNSRLFNSIDEVPRQAFTMGLSNIMNSKKILILANGEGKANAIRELVLGEIREEVPATILRNHPDCILICDEAAGKYI
jgi:glucosamine-6-phosphate deaminase